MSLNSCFVIMSFAKDQSLVDAYRLGIKPAVERLGFACHRTDDLPFTGQIYEQIIDQIRTSFFVVADITGGRPNCYYEIGFAHALGWKKNTFIVSRRGQEIHFDVQGYKILYYDNHEDLASTLTAEITGALLSTAFSYNQNDTQHVLWGGKAINNGRLLTARIDDRELDDDGDTLYDIRLQVETLPGAPQLTGNVTFHLHKEFGVAKTVRAQNGFAKYVITSVAGAFTVGAVCDRGKTLLEFDLGKIPGAVPGFYLPDQQLG